VREYYLFLDESKPNSNFENFTLGGIILEKDIYEKEIIPKVNNIKKSCFGKDTIILHEIDIRRKDGEYKGISKQQQIDFFDELKELFTSSDLFKIIAVSINISDLNILYRPEDRNDIYYIALQLLMENFTHFLTVNEGIGSIYLETTDICNNAKLQNLFHMLKATGTLFFTKESLQNKLSTINFAIKSENNIGLQLADFIPNPLAREALSMKQKPFSILPEIKLNLYDGGLAMPYRFGFKIIK